MLNHVFRQGLRSLLISVSLYGNASTRKFYFLLTATVKKWDLTYQAVKDIKGLKMVLNWVQDDELGCSCQAGPGSDLYILDAYM